MEERFESVLVLGFRADGSIYTDLSNPDGGEALWLLERAKHTLMREADRLEGEQ
jgi:hypothetical protein